ncbi:MAG: glutamate--tRNA ligase family protein, partial [Gemmatimonadaceae bacterium]
MSADSDAPRNNFIRELVAEDVETGRFGRPVTTRFPPEPNGFLHIGHAKSIVLNFGLAREFGGTVNLRFDDTNPFTEDMKYVEAIKEDVQWLGFEWNEERYASDYFGKLYDIAEALIARGTAYVDSQNEDEIREGRGTVLTAGTDSPYRDRPVGENLDLLRRMRAGEFPDGAHVLRAKIDMAHPNMIMRDPLLLRIRHASHYRLGDAWCIYPLYDFAHGLSDAIEGITRSLCTLEFKDNRDIYEWLVREAGFENPPTQIEFARGEIDYMIVSKRKLLRLVNE